ncbi:MAG: hypothetical protein KatS3mg118_3094 [Paracoccaceae bacterium]|nr:MAG: hypothetical protein KatS3mg118_3094 [Paracoccaceae bacterium]
MSGAPRITRMTRAARLFAIPAALVVLLLVAAPWPGRGGPSCG